MLAQVLKCPPSPLWCLKRALEQPGDAQRKLLRNLVRRAKDTAWGNTHGYNELLRSPDLIGEYQRRVPMSNYGDLQPYFDRVVKGESDVIWPGRPSAFAVSGGTRSGGRVIPLSREALASLTRSSLLPGLSYLANKPGALSMLRGKFLSLPGGVEAGKIGGRVAGEVSGLLAYRAPRLLSSWLQALPQRVMLMEDWEAKLIESARLAVRKDVRAMAMVPSWAPIFFERVREVVGTATVAEAIKKVWPNLRVFFSGGVALSSYRAILESYFGSGVDFVESYSASEGLFAFQDCSDQEGLIVNLNGGVFFEFVRVEEEHAEKPTRCTLDTVEAGVDYILYVTNSGGLWSLCVEDIVRFVSTQPPRLRVMGRVGEMLDRFGDATSADHARRTLTAADNTFGARCLSHHLTYTDPTDSPIPRHHWVLEFESAPGDLEAYARCLDEFMKQYNGRYRTRRDPGAMAGPVVTVVPSGSCAEYLKSTRKRFSGQSKIINVSEDDATARGIIAAARAIDESRVATVYID
jgi:hypothetical protein